MKCRDCEHLCWSTGLNINMCYAKFVPIGTLYNELRECEMYEQGRFREMYMFDPPHIDGVSG